MVNEHREARWRDFRRRVEYAPQDIYRHQARGWEYIPIHPFGDESALLAKLGMRAEECRSVDAWWGIDGEMTLLESRILDSRSGPARLFAKPTDHEDQSVSLVAVIEAPFVTRQAFEDAMAAFADAGFPSADRFSLRWGDDPVVLSH